MRPGWLLLPALLLTQWLPAVAGNGCPCQAPCSNGYDQAMQGPCVDDVTGGPGQMPGQAPGQGMDPSQTSAMAAPSAAGAVSVASTSSVGGYIDPAVVANRFRIRYDNMMDADRPDRAEFLYSHQVWQNAPNRAALEDIDLQELNIYFETLVTCGVSVFVELPVRWVDFPDASGVADDSGFGDLNFGFRAALYECCGDYLTFQLKVYTPTGDGDAGLGTGHTTIEPGLLFQRQVSCDTIVFGEARFWIPTDGTEVDDNTNGNGNFTGTVAGTVFRYGIGVSYDVWQQCCCGGCNCCGCCGSPYSRLAAVVELVGWTVLDGGAGEPTGDVNSAEGDTIINVKLGGRYTEGPHSIYAGWGHALTDDVWYEDIVRAEYQWVY